MKYTAELGLLVKEETVLHTAGPDWYNYLKVKILWNGNECGKIKRFYGKFKTTNPKTDYDRSRTAGEYGLFQLSGQPVNMWCRMYTWNYVRDCHSKCGTKAQEDFFFTGKFDWNIRKKLMKCYISSLAFYGDKNLDTSASRSETSWNSWNVVLKKGGKVQLDRSRENEEELQSRSKEISYLQ